MLLVQVLLKVHTLLIRPNNQIYTSTMCYRWYHNKVRAVFIVLIIVPVQVLYSAYKKNIICSCKVEGLRTFVKIGVVLPRVLVSGTRYL